jgi:predicted extracellular nuclease
MRKAILLLGISLCFAANLNLMFWNVENLFDIEDDPKKRDGDFLPGGVKRYTYRAYCLKVQHLADVINSVDPGVISMVEVENRETLLDLKKELHHSDAWEIIIDDGPDIRGIDPAVMFRSDILTYCGHYHYPVFIEERGYHSRPILRVDLTLKESPDTLSLFINHWPSRRGGKELSDKYRNYAAKILIEALRQTLAEHPAHFIVMTGDFNDDRHDECLEILCREESVDYVHKRSPKNINGTYYHEGEWIHFDHFMIANIAKTNIGVKEAGIIAPHWIREKDTNGPLRFYKGANMLGGYSDHYPITLKLSFKRKYVE